MSLLHLFLVALIQGITEFLPISSSGHLILIPTVLGAQDQGQFIDVSVHIGTLGAVVIYFWKDIRTALWGTRSMLLGDLSSPGAKLAFLLIIATIPAVAFGLLLKVTGLSDALRSPLVIGWTMLGFGCVLWLADYFGKTERSFEQWSLKDAITMGIWQAIALIPGTSRSGITITGARFLGYSRHSAARISMLMSIPIIIASATLIGAEAAAEANPEMVKYGIAAALLAFASALAALTLMMRLLQATSFLPYVIYRIVLGTTLLLVGYNAIPGVQF